jgi:hypothetical protein
MQNIYIDLVLAAGTHINTKFNSIGPQLHAGNWRHFIFMAWSAPLFAQVMKLAPKKTNTQRKIPFPGFPPDSTLIKLPFLFTHR